MSTLQFRNSPHFRRQQSLIILVAGFFLSFVGCSDSTSPENNEVAEVSAVAEGTFDPAATSFVLTLLDEPTPGLTEPIIIELIGTNLTVDPDSQTVALDVAVRNGWQRPLFAPAWIWLTGFRPRSVTVRNPDTVQSPMEPAITPELEPVYGFDYTELLGGDGRLDPGEVSGFRNWVFHVPDLVPFSFAARATFGLAPDLPTISGTCFLDENRNGVHDAGELPLARGRVRMVDPEGGEQVARPSEAGHYRFRVELPGLYQLDYYPIVPHIFDPVFTTPNPLRVVLPTGPDGLPESFPAAHFGVFLEGPPVLPPPVILTDLPPDSLTGAPFDFLAWQLRGDILRLQVAYSGCDPEHPFTLYMSGGFMESDPVQANLVLVHELDQDCEAYFRQELLFHLDPIRQAYQEAYGEPGVVILRLRDFQGEIHTIRFGP